MQQGDFQKHCTVFLARMRHSSSFELVQRVKGFINHFYGTQGSVEEYSVQIHRFLEVHLLFRKDCYHMYPHRPLSIHARETSNLHSLPHTLFDTYLIYSTHQEVLMIIQDHPLWKAEGSNEIKWAMEAMERYIPCI